MIYHLFYPLTEYFSFFNVTRYITFRGGCAFVTSFFLVMLFAKPVLKKLRNLKYLENINMYGHAGLELLHGAKKGTPTMGGVLILFSVLSTVFLWGRWDNHLIWLCISIMLALGLIGFIDDFLKIKRTYGLSRRDKLIMQCAVGISLGFWIALNNNLSTTWDFPFFKHLALDLGYFYVFWAALIIVATCNAVNFTDGLDGLAVGTLIINFLLFAFLSYIVGHIKFSNYLFIPYVNGAGELAVICLAIAGAGLGFLWFNAHPAEIFMGDVGALALGGVIGVIALIIKKEFLLFLSGGLFVMEALSVILQICSVRFCKKKIFLAAPLHHHFQIKGWHESKIIVRFWIVSILCVITALLTLKLR
ncbi:MAG: phospho-N-acetylmuramoyl-pentapeptide-transferase [Candidatus Omnitrophota bacterium]